MLKPFLPLRLPDRASFQVDGDGEGTKSAIEKELRSLCRGSDRGSSYAAGCACEFGDLCLFGVVGLLALLEAWPLI